jgi:PKD repeat protein
VVEADGNLVATDRINGIIRVNAATGEQTRLLAATPSNDFYGIVREASGNFIVADSGLNSDKPALVSPGIPGRIIRVDKTTGAQSVIAQGGDIVHPYGVAFDALDMSIVVSDMSSFNGQGAIIRVPLSGPQQVVWGPAAGSPQVLQSAPFNCPMGITIENTGNILATVFSYFAYGCANPGIFRVDLMNNVQTTVSANPPVGWRLPFGITTEENNNILVVDELLRGIYRLDPTGQFAGQTPLSGQDQPATPNYLASPVGITVPRFQPTVNIAVPPTVSIVGAPASSLEGTAISLTSTVTGPGTPAYSWTVTKTKNATTTSFASGSAASLTFTPDDNGTYNVGLTVTTSGGSGSASASISVTNVAPSVTVNGAPANGVVGVAINLSSSVSDPSSADTLAGFIYAWSVTRNGSFVTSGTTSSLSFTPNAAGSYVVTLTVTDQGQASGMDSRTVNVVDVPPTASIGGAPASSPEGTAINLTSTVSGTGTLSYAWGVTKNGIAFAAGPGTSLSFTPDDNGTYVVTLAVTNTGGTATDSKTIDVTNVAPVIPSGGVTGPTAPLALGTPSTVLANFTDVGTADTHSCTFDWDDLLTTTVSGSPGVSETNGSGSCQAAHTFAGPGVYNVAVTVTDDDGGSATARVSQYVVIYDAAEGSVSGSGWIDSLAGAYLPNPALTGKAKFGFESKYKQGATVPTGQTEFNFKAAKFKFKSTVYEWLVISGSKAQYKGSGVVKVHDSSHAGDDECENESHWRQWTGDYKFILTAQDGGLSDGKDKFRIKITDTVTDQVIYDNRRGDSDDMDVANPQIISGGRITIKKN